MKLIVRLKGGLGNQLFCYAAARRLALFNQVELVIDDVTGFARDRTYKRRYALDSFNIPCRKATPSERLEPFERYRRALSKYIARRQPFHLRRYVEQEGIDFDPRLLEYKVKGKVYLDGLWQSEGYFKDVADVIRKDLTIIPPEDEKNKETAKRIQSCNAIAVHARWFESPNSQSAAHNLDKEYYMRAIRLITNRVTDPHFFVFSDGRGPTESLLDLPGSMMTSVNHNRGNENAFADLWLMAQCKHFVIANSTFSWWGAWLARYARKTIVGPGLVQSGTPSWGFKGLIPQEWILV